MAEYTHSPLCIVIDSIGISNLFFSGNYTYYSLTEHGDITIILLSLIGDADVYVSQQPQPTALDYELSSTTYGPDVVTVTADMERPCGVGVYGHIRKELSKYRLVALLNYTGEHDETLRDPVAALNLFAGSGDGGGITRGKNGKGRDGGGGGTGSGFFSSTMWQIFEFLLKILAEVLL